MNKYKQFSKSGRRDMTVYLVLSNIKSEQIEAARMRKPGYRRKMRHTKNKHIRNTSH